MPYASCIARVLAMATLAMLTAGCFTSAQPLLLPSDATQPVEQGLWILYGQDNDRKPPRTFDCRTYVGRTLCRSGFEDARLGPNRSYMVESLRLAPAPMIDENDNTVPDDEPWIHQTWFSDIGDGFYLIQQDRRELSRYRFNYALGLLTTLDDGRAALFIYAPMCDRNPELHDLAPPDPSDDDYCNISSRQNLFRLMHRFKLAVRRGAAPTLLYVKG